MKSRKGLANVPWSWQPLHTQDKGVPGMAVNRCRYIWVFPKKMGTTKSSILIGFSTINHPFWGTPIFGYLFVVDAGPDFTKRYLFEWSPTLGDSDLAMGNLIYLYIYIYREYIYIYINYTPVKLT